ncbi:MAG TPA: hypothetical protein VHW67_03010 [Solirubrobacteraceae bacterium]|jgi:hypothetical protein|nr:hypothetical protein [Solirubrobacteraceae bacterium]
MQRISRHLSYANVAATLALLFAMGGGAIAATGGFSPGGTLRACVNEEGALRLLKSGKLCRKGQKVVTWNQTGPVGARGATGATGAAGAPGVTGAKGANGPEGPAGEGANVKWGSISTTGHVLAGQGVVAAADTVGHYAVAFDQDITQCAVVVGLSGQGDGDTVEVERAGTEAKVYMRHGTAVLVETDFSIVAEC